jgi:hypothetical protein
VLFVIKKGFSSVTPDLDKGKKKLIEFVDFDNYIRLHEPVRM